jgi:hypothetical protein
MLPPVLLDWLPKMLPEFVLEPKPGDAEARLDKLNRHGVALII